MPTPGDRRPHRVALRVLLDAMRVAQPRDGAGRNAGMRDANRCVGHPHGPRRSMPVTKWRTVGGWPPAPWQSGSAEPRAPVRGRVITGLLTGDDAPSGSPPGD